MIEKKIKHSHLQVFWQAAPLLYSSVVSQQSVRKTQDIKQNPARATHLKRNSQHGLKFIPQIPSLMREEGMKPGWKPALVQWKLPLGQAAVPANKCY